MIARIKGQIVAKAEDFAIVEANNIGYKIYLSEDVLAKTKLKQNVSFWTYLVVRENLMDLYGFLDQKEKSFFGLLISISGIGPKSAMSILDLASIETLRKAVVLEDDSYLTRVSGIGKKTAQKILLELKDKLDITESDDSGTLKEETDVLEALKQLGYSLKEARDALKGVPNDIKGSDKKIKEALKILGNG